MARIRKTEPALTVSSAAAAPARRKTATATPKQIASQKSSQASATETNAAISESIDVPSLPAPEHIAELAYSYWVGRGCQGGSPEEDWLRAEQALLLRAPALA